jgi:antitoxin component of RelBE/YafQ-DinJ toxin-antitoxin module
METAIIATRLGAAEKRKFERLTKTIGMSPQSAIKVFIACFNRGNGFPFQISVPATRSAAKNRAAERIT